MKIRSIHFLLVCFREFICQCRQTLTKYFYKYCHCRYALKFYLPVCFSMSNILAWNTGSTASTLTPCEVENCHLVTKSQGKNQHHTLSCKIVKNQHAYKGIYSPTTSYIYELIPDQVFSIVLNLDVGENTYCSWLGHGKHINHSHCVVINKFSQHQSHDLHWYTSTPVLQHLMKSKYTREITDVLFQIQKWI